MDKKYLQSIIRYVIIYIKKGATVHKVVGQVKKIEDHPLYSGKVLRVVFYMLKHYLRFKKMNVSNAKMNIPKAMRSLKSKFLLSIRITPSYVE